MFEKISRIPFIAVVLAVLLPAQVALSQDVVESTPADSWWAGSWWYSDMTSVFVLMVFVSAAVIYFIQAARKGKDFFDSAIETLKKSLWLDTTEKISINFLVFFLPIYKI